MVLLESRLYPRVLKEKYQEKPASRADLYQKSRQVYVKELKKQVNLRKW